MTKRILITEDNIDDFVLEWHQINPNCELREYLGMTEKEYGKFMVVGKLPKRDLFVVKEYDFELNFCYKCFQMTNHLGGICQKCKGK